MAKNEFREQLFFRNYKWTAPKYYDYPDGQDLIGKLVFTTKISFFVGSLYGFFHIQRFPLKPRSVSGTIIHFLTYIVPCVGAATAFTTTTYLSTNLRKKDDQLNYIAGSVAAAVVGGHLARKPEYRLIFSVLFSVVGFAKKTAQMHGLELFPSFRKRYDPPYFDRILDFSLIEEGVPDWTREAPKAE